MSADTETGVVDQTSTEQDESNEGAPSNRMAQLEQEGEIAADYLEELLDIADLDGDLDIDVEGDRAAVSIVGADLQQLVGRDGDVLEALQELTRLAVYRETGERSRLMLDVSGFRAERRAQLVTVATETVERVKASGEPVSLDPMSPFERKVVHDAVAAAGLTSESEGAGAPPVRGGSAELTSSWFHVKQEHPPRRRWRGGCFLMSASNSPSVMRTCWRPMGSCGV